MRAEHGIRDAERRRHRRLLRTGDRGAGGHRRPACLLVSEQGLVLRQRPAVWNAEAGGGEDGVRASGRYRRYRGRRRRPRYSPDARRRLHRARARRQRLLVHRVLVHATVRKDVPRMDIARWALALAATLVAAKAVLLALLLVDGALPVARPWLPVAL